MPEVVNESSEQPSSRLGAVAVDALLQDKYRKLTRDHLEELPRLFQKLTGLKSCLAWAPAWPRRWKPRELPTYSSLCRQSREGDDAAVVRCQRCGTRHLALTLKSGHEGHSFTCHRGIRNFWFPIIVRQCAVGIAFVQAPNGKAGSSVGHKPSQAATSAAFRRNRGQRRHRTAAKQVNRQQFEQAAGLLRLIFEHVQTCAVADLRQDDLTKAQQAMLELQTVAGRLREDLNGLVPGLSRTRPVAQPENRAQGIVRAVLERIQRDYARPITLQQCAGDLDLNAAYLSTLFSRSVGLPFKSFLTEVRLEKARELLSDPARSIADVACAVGYASENRFRITFKGATGLSPKVWRETLRMERPSPGRASV